MFVGTGLAYSETYKYPDFSGSDQGEVNFNQLYSRPRAIAGLFYQPFVMNIRFLFTSSLILLSTLKSFGQQDVISESLQKKYTVFNRVISAGPDNGGVHLNEEEGPGIAWITGQEFSHGTIELDIKGKDLLQKSFVGFAFHGLNDTTYEAIYFRPFNFQSTDPVRKLHAVQYIAGPLYDWSKLRTEYPGKYEQPVSPVPDPNDWFHARITIEPKKISVYVNGNSNPSLVVEPLVPMRGKHIGYWVGNNSAGDWKNLKITPAK